MTSFTHLDARGHARMVDVSQKASTQRVAVARSRVVMRAETLEMLSLESTRGAEVLQSARVAAVLAAKRTSELIPLCHSLPVAPIAVEFHGRTDHLEITSTAHTYERTGVEMEALVGCSIAALSIYAACRDIDDSVFIDGIALWEKIGGKSGHWRRDS